MPQAVEAPPAGGAALDQVVIATGMGMAVTVALLVLCAGHRSGRVGLLAWGDRISTRFTGLPGWAGVPSAVALVILPSTLFGLQWDESLHIAQGRDEGPLANPSHYFLLAGIFAGFAAGVIGMAMADERVPSSGIRVREGWTAPLGAVLTAAGAGVALLGFPLDDVWHRIFGQDVTLWSPTHVTMIGGMALCVVGLLVLNVEAVRARRASSGGGAPPFAGLARWAQRFWMPAALLLLLSLMQGEFDYGVPQFPLVFHPMTVMAAAGLGLVAARVFMGPGAALGGALLFIAVRGIIVLLVGPVLGEPVHAFPLYLAEALIVEAVALRVSPRRALRFGVTCGVLLGTVGLAAEWAWSGVFQIPWTSGLLPEGVILGFAMAVAGSIIGAWLGAHLHIGGRTGDAMLRRAAVGAAVVVTGLIGFCLIQPEAPEVRGIVTLTEVTPAPDRTVQATVRLVPPDAADGATWLRTVAWQGGGFETDALERVSPGVYRTTVPVPVYGSWKSSIRLHTGLSLTSLPLYLPEDPAIPAEGLAAPPHFERAFADEAVVLRREAKDVAGWIWTAASAAVALGMMVLLAAWAAALHRLAVAPLSTPRAAAPGSGESSRRAVLSGT
jgi:hypothetical protein